MKDETVLYRLDPVLYKADLEQAKAAILQADADLAKWTAQIVRDKADLKRINEQLTNGVGVPADKDKAVATLAVSEAQKDVAAASKAAAGAGLAKAEENLKYCTIYAPTDGVARRSRVSERDVVTAYQTSLVDISPVETLYAVWEVDELTSLWYRDQIVRGAIADPRNPATPLQVWITLKDGSTYPPPDQPGRPLGYIDPELVRETGTRTVRAEFTNPEVARAGPDGKGGAVRELSSGDSVRVRVSAGTSRKEVMIPVTVVVTQARQKIVYVLNDRDEVEARPVELGQTQGDRVVVAAGLTPADRVVASNLLRVRPGITVKVQDVK